MATVSYTGHCFRTCIKPLERHGGPEQSEPTMRTCMPLSQLTRSTCSHKYAHLSACGACSVMISSQDSCAHVHLSQGLQEEKQKKLSHISSARTNLNREIAAVPTYNTCKYKMLSGTMSLSLSLSHCAQVINLAACFQLQLLEEARRGKRNI